MENQAGTAKLAATSHRSTVAIGASDGMCSGRSGGLLPDALPSAGWEKRHEAPSFSPGSIFAVYGKRVAARTPLCLPPISSSGAMFACAVKVDVEAFDAQVETSTGVEYGCVPMEETVAPWTDSQSRYAWVPTAMSGGALFRGPHNSTPSGTTFSISASCAFRAYVVVEASHKTRKACSGGFVETLPAAGFRVESSSPSWGDNASKMQSFSKKATEGEVLFLPPTVGDVIFSIVVVNISANTDRLTDELKQAFKSWDVDSKGAIRREDLNDLLRVLCPTLDSETRSSFLSEIDRCGNNRISYEEFVDRIMVGA